MTNIKPSILFEIHREAQTASIKRQADAGLLEVPPIPSGQERYRFDIGDTVTASETSPVQGAFVVDDRYTENGYCYYKSGPHTFRDRDLT